MPVVVTACTHHREHRFFTRPKTTFFKFLSKTGKPEEDIKEFEQEILTSDQDDNLKILGVISANFDTNTLRKLNVFTAQ